MEQVPGTVRRRKRRVRRPSAASSQNSETPEHRNKGLGTELLKAVEEIAKQESIKYLSMVYMETSMPQEVKHIYNKLGYTQQEVMFTKVL